MKKRSLHIVKEHFDVPLGYEAISNAGLCRLRVSQQPACGLATLLFCLILLASATTLIFTMSRTSLAEQRIMGNEYRAETLRQACEAGLDYGLAWLRQHEPEWQMNSNGQYSLSIPLPADHLGQDSGIQILVSSQTNDINSPFFQLLAQASRESAGATANAYHMRQFVHYTTINGAGNEASNKTGAIAKVITVPGTWHDYE